MRTIGIAALATVALFAAPCVAQTLAPRDQLVYPERVTVPEALRTKLMTYKVTMKKTPGGPFVALSKEKTLPPIEYDKALYPFGVRPSPFAIPNTLREDISVPWVKRWDYAQFLDGDESFPELLDKLTTLYDIGWTAEEAEGTLRVRFVRIRKTPNPEFFTTSEDLTRFPEKVTVSEALRKRLEEIKVDISIVDRNGVGAILSLLDARVDHQFDPKLQISKEARTFAEENPLIGDPNALIKSDPEWLYPGLRLNKVTILAKQVPLSNALDLLTRTLGVGWAAELVGGRPLVRIVRLRGTPSPDIALFQVLEQHRSLPDPEKLPRKEWVSLEIENADVQSAVEKLLSARPRRVVVAPGASALRRSFRFTRVGLSTALDLLCDSYGTTWSLEHDSSGAAYLSIRKRGDAPPMVGK